MTSIDPSLPLQAGRIKRKPAMIVLLLALLLGLQPVTTDLYLREGFHVDGRRQSPVDVVAGEWPAYIAEGRCPPEWFRLR